ncbi:PP2C family protein-serine/threonine phosphatase [Aurantibacillus circumpalustris]|uniref:PP2C family protein-serine/threonine phosphatase n=1 Tax=Aurantibacillus circumpalustris TaxID=3036359 RepID=UPI00295BC06D|nr:PP2C family protein-serine/threonine phosphatase [Aurantibacillus circumpalustris]
MAEGSKISKQKRIQDLKLNALLEVTKAINSNLSTAQLLDLYQEILENRLGVGKLILFHFDKEWTCILKYGMGDEFSNMIFEDELLAIHEIETITFSKGLLSKSFEIVIPVFHKKTPLAFVLLGDVNQDKLELSAAIKHLPYVQTLTNIIIVAIENKKLYKEHIERAEIKKELELAQNMQQMLFPQELPNTDAFQVAAKYLPHQQVGGDYYDFIQLNNHEFIFCIADVSGKGVAAALLMSNMQATLHSLINYTHNLKDIIIELNKRVIDNTKSEKFVSLFLAKLNTKSQQFSYINAGHNPPIFYYENKFRELNKGCTILGISENLAQIQVETFNYTSEFTLVCYTDGLTDTSNSENDSLSVDSLKDIIAKNDKSKPEFLNEALMFFAEEFKGENEFPDDIALLTLKVSDLNF